MAHQNLTEYLDHFFKGGSEIAYVHHRGYRTLRWSYRQIAEAACQFARELEFRGITHGDRIVIWGENCAEWVVAFWGCLLRGAVAVPMDRIATSDFAQSVAHQVAAKLIVRARELPDPDPKLPSLLLETLPETISRYPKTAYAPPPLKRNDIVEIVFTSGTTADPKGVVITHGNILANLEPLEIEIRKYLKYERLFHPIRFLNLLPLSHVFGQFLGLFIPQLLRGTVIFQETLNPTEIGRTIRQQRVSVLVAVPRLLDSLKHKIERDYESRGQLEWFKQQLAAAEKEHFIKRWWRFRKIHNEFGWKFWALISGGATLDAQTEVFWQRLSFVVIQGYGLTETTSLISINHPFQLGKGSIGKVLPGRELKLDVNGEILVRGESVASGYWQHSTLKPVLADEGWFHTGDLGELDDEGRLYFKGRKKNVIVTPAGMNVYPEDLEAALRRQPEVKDCVVVGIAQEGNAEPCAVLILQDGTQDPEAVVHRANESLAEYQRMRRWVVWPERDFPRTATQKPRTNLIQERLAALLGGPAQLSTEPGIVATLIGRLTGRSTEQLSPDMNLTTDLNLSSIDRIELLSAIEDRCQVTLNEAGVTEALTIGDLEKMLQQPPPIRPSFGYPRCAQQPIMNVIRGVVYYLLVWPATFLLAHPKIRGRENLQGVQGPALFICNHITYIDIGFILAALPLRYRHRLAVAMEGERLQAMRHPDESVGFFRRWILSLSYALAVGLFNVFPLPQRAAFRESFAYAGQSVDRGYSVLVFPEGERTRTGRMAPFRPGIGLLTKNLNIPVVPMRIDGLHALKQAGKKIAPAGTIKVTIGRPIHFPTGLDAKEITQLLESKVKSLNPEGS